MPTLCRRAVDAAGLAACWLGACRSSRPIYARQHAPPPFGAFSLRRRQAAARREVSPRRDTRFRFTISPSPGTACRQVGHTTIYLSAREAEPAPLMRDRPGRAAGLVARFACASRARPAADDAPPALVYFSPARAAAYATSAKIR